ncbi:MAG: hypothetical protein Q7U85_09445 [Rhodocyclaceae bacterium]|nr:hypothetical protein [Rhodocyclaceae bacterium]
MDGVAQQVDHDLLELHLVAEYRRQGRRQFFHQDDGALSVAEAGQFQHLARHLVQANARLARRLPRHQFPHARDDFRRAMGLVNRGLQHFDHLRVVELAATGAPHGAGQCVHDRRAVPPAPTIGSTCASAARLPTD